MSWKDLIEPFFRKVSPASDTLAVAYGATAVLETKAAEGAKAKYHRISPKEAKAAMESGEAVTVLDVREPYEYHAGHIPNAVLLPSGSVSAKAGSMLPDKDVKILVYCLSGVRSSAAAHRLVRLGYTNVYDFGGIADWPFGVVKH
ncbi:MAG: rhodanese-like domain-containing protein [Bacillota bacterium]